MGDSMAIIMQTPAAQQPPAPQITQSFVIAIVVASVLFVIGLLVLIAVFAQRTENPLAYGNFFVVALGITTALIGFLAAFPLLISRAFTDSTQVLALLSALFGTIVGLVGTYFGVKASGDAREGAQRLARETMTTGTAPTLSSVNPLPGAKGVPPNNPVTATFSNDINPATLDSNTFKLVEREELTPVTGKIEYDPATKRATFTPSTALENGTTYRATITAAVKDQAGNVMAQDHTWEFTVARRHGDQK